MLHQLPDPADTLEVCAETTASLLASDSPPVLIDCREQHEYDYCHIKGATLIPLSRFVAMAQTSLEHTELPVIIYCHHGVRSYSAAQYLRQQGFLKCFSMAGGIHVWSERIDPSVPTY